MSGQPCKLYHMRIQSNRNNINKRVLAIIEGKETMIQTKRRGHGTEVE